jgi:DNA-binding beta-propeller fold protein YncE
MALELEGYIELPEHQAAGGFDHAAVHRGLRRLYVAHTANDAIDVIDLERGRYSHSIEGLGGVAGALVSEDDDLLFSSNRAASTVSAFAAREERVLATVPVGPRPNGLAFDPARRTLIAATVAEPYGICVVDLNRGEVRTTIDAPGRTRWAIYDPTVDVFFVNIADPPSIVMVDAEQADVIARQIPIPAAGPHGLDVDAAGRLYCACDAGRLFVLEPPDYDAVADLSLAGTPDVIFLDRSLAHLYVAIGEPGLIEVFDVADRRPIDAVSTEPGTHTIGFDQDEHRVYAFLPESHRAAVFRDRR